MRRLLGLLVCVTACGSEPVPPTSDLALLAMSSSAALQAVPQTRDEFLDVLAPLPADGVRVDYEVQGPGGLTGVLQITMQPGGRRLERWVLELPLADGQTRRIEDSATQTADYIWTGQGDTLEVDRAPLGALADAYLALPDDERREVVDSLRDFRLRVDDARTHAPGPAREILGIACLSTRLAAQELCVWEQTGLPLDYRGNAFSLRATAIDLSPQVSAKTFAVPTEVQRSAPGPDLDPGESLRRLARRDYAELGPLLHPGLRLALG